MLAFEEKINSICNQILPELKLLSDQVYDYAEIGYQEYQSCACLAAYLQEKRWRVTVPYGGLPTAFRAEKVIGAGGKTFAFLGEYDALAGQGHGCAHHMQSPAMIGAATALVHLAEETNTPCKVVIIGTPAEESLDGGKNPMAKNGAFDDLDLVFMVHGGTKTQLDGASLSLIETDVTFHGISSHTGIAPHEGRSALDAAVLMGTGLGLLRGHVPDGTRIHHIILDGGSTVNSIPDFVRAKLEVRYHSMEELQKIYARILKVVEGAAIATETTYTLEPVAELYDTKINTTFGKVLMKYAQSYNCDNLAERRSDVGSTDFGIVTRKAPCCCLRVKFIEEDFPPHTIQWVEAGKKPRNYQGILDGARCCAAAAWEILNDQDLYDAIYQEHNASIGMEG